jgi:hypothetical protein
MKVGRSKVRRFESSKVERFALAMGSGERDKSLPHFMKA